MSYSGTPGELTERPQKAAKLSCADRVLLGLIDKMQRGEPIDRDLAFIKRRAKPCNCFNEDFDLKISQ